MKAVLILNRILLMAVIMIAVAACDFTDDNIQEVEGIVKNQATLKPVEGVRLTLKKCTEETIEFWFTIVCNNYETIASDYSGRDGGFDFKVKEVGELSLKVQRTDLNIYIDSITAYKVFRVEKFRCPAISPNWVSTEAGLLTFNPDEVGFLEVEVTLKEL